MNAERQRGTQRLGEQPTVHPTADRRGAWSEIAADTGFIESTLGKLPNMRALSAGEFWSKYMDG